MRYNKQRYGILFAILLSGILFALCAILSFGSIGSRYTAYADETPEAEHVHEIIYKKATDATCTENGNTEYWTCTVCEKYFSDENGTEIADKDSVVIGALGHDFEHDFTVDVNPSCTKEGSKSKHCSRCVEKTEVTPVAKLSHIEEIDPGEEATCTESGKTEGKHCSVCGTVLQKQETIRALGHDYGEWTVTKEATNEEAGEKERVCSRDETHVDVREIPKVQSYGGFLVIFVIVILVAGLVVGLFVSFLFHDDWQRRRRR